MHWIQRHILELLIHNETKRFSELRAEGVESNLFQYHLRHIIKKGYVEKVEGGYRLAPKGLSFADRYSALLKGERQQAKVISLAVIRDSCGRVMLKRKMRQPWLGQYHLPAGKVHDGEMVSSAVARETLEKTGFEIDDFEFRGSLHVQIYSGEYRVSEFYGFVFAATHEGGLSDDTLMYDGTNCDDLAPSVREILDLEMSGTGEFREVVINI